MKPTLKRLLMALALAAATNFALFEIPTAGAVDAHHGAQTVKNNKAKTPAGKKSKGAKSSKKQTMNCPMMGSGTMHQGMKHMKC